MAADRGDLSAAESEDHFYGLLAGAAGARVLESVVALELPALLARRGPPTAKAIIAALKLDPHRGQKWLELLLHMGLLEPAPSRHPQPRYQAGPLMRALFYADGTPVWFYQDFLRYFNTVLNFDTVDVLRGASVPDIAYPPRTPAEVEALEGWMRTTAGETMETIERVVSLKGTQRLLDVAGGDGTMAVHYARRHPQLHVTVFNLPASAAMARRNVAKAGLSKRITVVEGDFRRDPLPRGYQMVQFSRVLADWPEDVCRLLLGKARASLSPGGRVVICEPLADDNPDLTLAWHFSYLPYDDFGARLYKPLAAYERMLQELGFHLLRVARKDRHGIHAVIVAQRPDASPAPSRRPALPATQRGGKRQ
ncbi:MAG: methyltransferase domain-containing protein [Nitrospirae bacterium]|nr:MAG: methyltransferase domain-containing protein [Nitrospirota bacterium]